MLRYISAFAGVVSAKYLRDGEETGFLDLGADAKKGLELDLVKDIPNNVCVEMVLTDALATTLLKRGRAIYDQPVDIDKCTINNMECLLPAENTVVSALDNFVSQPSSVEVGKDSAIVCYESRAAAELHIYKAGVHLKCPFKAGFPDRLKKERSIIVKPTRLICPASEKGICRDHPGLKAKTQADTKKDASETVTDMFSTSPSIAEQLRSVVKGRIVLIDSAISSDNIGSLQRVQVEGTCQEKAKGKSNMEVQFLYNKENDPVLPAELKTGWIDETLQKGGGVVLTCPLTESGTVLGFGPQAAVVKRAVDGMTAELKTWFHPDLAGVGADLLAQVGKSLELGWGDESLGKSVPPFSWQNAANEEIMFAEGTSTLPLLLRLKDQLEAHATQRIEPDRWAVKNSNAFSHSEKARAQQDLSVSAMHKLLASANLDVDALIVALLSSGESSLAHSPISSAKGRTTIDFARMVPKMNDEDDTSQNAHGRVSGQKKRYDYSSFTLGQLAGEKVANQSCGNEKKVAVVERLYNQATTADPKTMPTNFRVNAFGVVNIFSAFFESLTNILYDSTATPEDCVLFLVSEGLDVLVCEGGGEFHAYHLGAAGEGTSVVSDTSGSFTAHGLKITVTTGFATASATDSGGETWPAVKGTGGNLKSDVTYGYQQTGTTPSYRKVNVRTVRQTGHVYLSAKKGDTEVAIGGVDFLPFHLQHTAGRVFSGGVSIHFSTRGVMTLSCSSRDLLIRLDTFRRLYHFGDRSAVFLPKIEKTLLDDQAKGKHDQPLVAIGAAGATGMPVCSSVDKDWISSGFEHALVASKFSLIHGHGDYPGTGELIDTLSGGTIDISLFGTDKNVQYRVARRALFGSFPEGLKQHIKGAQGVSTPTAGLKVPTLGKISANRMLLLLEPTLSALAPERLLRQARKDSSLQNHQGRFPLREHVRQGLYETIKSWIPAGLNNDDEHMLDIEVSAPHPADSSKSLDILLVAQHDSVTEKQELYGYFTGCGSCLVKQKKNRVLVDVLGSQSSSLIPRRLSEETCFDAPELNKIRQVVQGKTVNHVGGLCKKVAQCTGEKGLVDETIQKTCDDLRTSNDQRKEDDAENLKKYEENQNRNMAKIPAVPTAEQIAAEVKKNQPQDQHSAPDSAKAPADQADEEAEKSSCC